MGIFDFLRALWGRNSDLAYTGNGKVTRLNTYTTDTGIAVSPETAMRNATYFTCVSSISSDLAGLPFPTYLRLDQGRERVRDHRVHRLLNEGPNDLMCAFSFRETATSHVLQFGNALAYIHKVNGYAEELLPLIPSQVSIERRNGGLVYWIDGIEEPIGAEYILHVPGLSFDGIRGRGVIEDAANAVGIALACDRFAARYFANGAHPSGALKHPGRLSDDARTHLKESLSREYGGVDNAGGTMVLEEGMEFQTIAPTLEQAQFLESRRFQSEEIARLFRMSGPMSGDLSRAILNNVQELGMWYVRYTLRRWIIKWEQEVNRKLYTEEEKRQGYYSEVLVDGLERADQTTRYQNYMTGIQGGFIKPTQIAEWENWNPDGMLDEYLSPLNMAPASERVEDKPKEENAERYRPLIEDAARRILTKERNAIARAWKKYDTASDFNAWVDEFYTKHEQLIRDTLSPVVKIVEPTEQAQHVIDTMAAEHVADSKADIARALDTDDVETLLDAWGQRHEHIAEQFVRGNFGVHQV